MTGNVAQFNKAIRDFAQRIVPEQLVQVQRKISLDALGKLGSQGWVP